MKTILVFCFSCFSLFLAAQHSRIFPQPSSVQYPSAHYYFAKEIVAEGSADAIKAVNSLTGSFEKMTGLKLATDGYANLHCIENERLAAEAYVLRIDASGITVEYKDEAGLFYAIESLMWQFDPAPGGFPYAEINDSPRFSWRGVHLDCSRHFFTVPEIKQFLDRLALFKINRFHWHLTDDQGWRIEIKKYPKLTEVGGWRDQTLVGHFSNEPAVYDGKRYGGYYTQEEVKDVIIYAQRLHIEIVPEIEMPGHARAALAAYPELGCTGSGYTVAETWGVFEDIFCSKQETRDFLKDVLAEVCELFPYEVIHIGGDEAPKKKWNECPNCAKVRSEYHLANAHELQSFFVNDMVLFLKSKGKRLMGWDEILEGGLPSGAEVMSWRGTEGGIAAAKAKHPVVMTPTAYCYFDYYQSSSPKEPLCIGGYLPVEKVYSYDPVPKELNEEEKRYILGTQANLWSEYLPTMERVYEQLFPRLFALAENGWSSSKASYAEFSEALSKYGLNRLEQLGIPYSKTYLYPVIKEYSDGRQMEYCFLPTTANTSCSDSYGNSEIRIPASNLRTVSKWMYIRLNGEKTDSLQFNLLQHYLLGTTIHFATPPSEKYNVNQAIALTDGIIGEKPWKGNQWLGFDTSIVQFSFIVPQKVKTTLFHIGFLNDPGSWIYRPHRFMIERKTKRGYEMVDKFAIEHNRQKFPAQLFSGEYRITIWNYGVIPEGSPGEGFTPWTFIDEIFIE